MAEPKGKSIFVRIEDCLKIHIQTNERMHKFDLALFGEDGRAGMVKDIADIRSDLAIIKSATGLMRQILVPILSSLITAGVMYLILRG